MAGICNKLLSVCVVLVMFVAGMQPQSSTPASPAETAASPKQAQTPETQQKPVPVYESATVLKTITRLVVVDVVATDKNGPVTSLRREDFKIIEDGIEQKVKVFNFQQPRTTPAAGTGNAEKLPANIYSNVPRYNVDSSLNVVLMDALNTTLPHQAYVRDQMIRYLEKMTAGRPVAVYTLGRNLTLLQDFTSDPELLKSIVRSMKSKASPLQDNPGGGPDNELLPPGLADSGIMPAEMLNAMERFEQERVAFQTDLRVSYTVNALMAIARSLSGYPGRKNLIWISEAFPLNIDPNMDLTTGFAGTRNYGPQIAELADSLIDAQIAMYPVDARGLVPSSVFDVSNTGRDRMGRSMARNGRMGSAMAAESAMLQNVHGTMQEIADRTGGKAFYNTNDIDGAIRNSVDDGSTYYTLAYYPENKNWNGKFRKVHVKVDLPGIKLRHRLGYYAVDPKLFAGQNEKQRATAFALALSPDTPIATALIFHAAVIPPTEKAPTKVLVNFGVDPHAITFEQESDGLQHATVECAVHAYSTKGGRLMKGESTTMKASLKPETYSRVMREGFPCQQAIELAPGNYFLRLGVRDDRSGLIGTTNAKLAVASNTASASPEKK